MNLRSIKKERVQSLKTKLKEVASSAILDAAEEVFAEHGLDVRMEAIAARAGVSVGTLYNHFADRNALLLALAETRRAAVFELIRQAVHESRTLPFRDHLVHVVSQLCDVTGTKARFRRRLIESDMPGARRRQIEAQEFFTTLLEPSFARARKANLLVADPYKIQVALFFGLMKSVITRHLDEHSKIPVKQLAAAMVDTFLHGVSS